MANNPYDRKPWSFAELDAVVAPQEPDYEYDESGIPPTVRPVGPMTTEEANDYLERLVRLAADRPLTEDELFLHGQLREALEQAAMAAVLRGDGKRYIVVSEDTLRAHRKL